MTKPCVIALSWAAALGFVLAACGGPGTARFALCGNGVIDPGEQCDNGNGNSDNGNCLTTCVSARCGDSFIDSESTPPEECDTYNINGATCSGLGFGSEGTVTCAPNCTFDTSGCSPFPTAFPTRTASLTPTPTVTPTSPGTPTVTPTGPIPTATVTPTVGCKSVTVTVRLLYDVNAVPELAGLVLDLNYPQAVVSIPGSGSDDSVVARVTDVSGAQGFAVIEDRDTNDDGQDDQLHTAYVTSGNISPGDFEQVLFDCTAGEAAPTADAFTCVVSDTVDPQAQPVTGVTCEISIATVLQPTPTAPPPSATPTATATAAPPTATAIPTCALLRVTVALDYDVNAIPELAGLVLDLNYPASVALPGSGSDDSVVARVTDVSGANGFAVIEDRDTNSDGQDDQLHTAYVTSGNIPPGNFEQVLFDCVSGSIPASTDFSCVVSDTVDPQALPVDGVTCSVRINPSE